MTDIELKIFVGSVANYFTKITQTPASIGIPYVKGTEILVQEYTGVIGLTGKRKGGIYITCSRQMLVDLIADYLQASDPSEEIVRDMLGEMANVISGNVSDSFGSGFEISVPVIIVGKPDVIELPTKVPSFVIPINWKKHTAHLVVGLD